MADKENRHGIQFQFRKRYRKVDWKMVSSVDVDRIAQDLDYHALQCNIMNIAFCDTQSQDFDGVDQDVIKLYRLGQYTIEYLLHCQEYLSHGTVELESKLRDAMKFRLEVKEKLECKQKELTEVKKESRKRKKMIAVYQGMINTSGGNGFHKCTECDKAFVSAPFLESHLERRHNIAPSTNNNNNIGSMSADKLRIKCEEQYKEIEQLQSQYRDRGVELKTVQESCDRALTMRDSTLLQQQELETSYKRWKEEETERHEKDLEEVKDIYLRQASEALEEKRIAELALVEAKKGIVSNLGALRDEHHEHDDLRQEQLIELEQQFEIKITQLQQEVERQSRKIRDAEDANRRNVAEAKQREAALLQQLAEKTDAERRLQDILQTVEIENAKLVQLHREEPNIHSALSPQALAQLAEAQFGSGSIENMEVAQHMLATQTIDITRPAPPSHDKPRFAPFPNKPHIKAHYAHTHEQLEIARREIDNDMAVRLLNLAGTMGLDSVTTEEYNLYKSKIDEDRLTRNTTHDIRKLNSELDAISRDQPQAAELIPTKLPPKSPSFKKSREALSRPNSSKRPKTTPPSTPPNASPILAPKSRDHDVIPRDHAASQPDMSHVISSTPKTKTRSVGSLEEHHKQSEQKYSHFDSDDDIDISDIIDTTNQVDRAKLEHFDEEASQSEEYDEVYDDGESDDVIESRDQYAVTSSNREEVVGESGESEEELEMSLENEQPAYVPSYQPHDQYNPLDDESEDEPTPATPRTPSPVETAVKRRAHKTYSRDMEEADSIFSFDGWTKMKNRTSMSADDAQQNIPKGHVTKMREAVDALQQQKRVKLNVGVSVLPDAGVRTVPSRDFEEDDFTISSLSDRDISPVGMTVDIKRGNTSLDDI